MTSITGFDIPLADAEITLKQSRNNILSTLKQSWKKEFDQHFLNIFSTLNIDHVVQLWKFNFRLFFTFNVGSTFNDGLAMKYGLSMVWIQNKLILLNTLEISPEGASWNTSYKTFKHFLFFFQIVVLDLKLWREL